MQYFTRKRGTMDKKVEPKKRFDAASHEIKTAQEIMFFLFVSIYLLILLS